VREEQQHGAPGAAQAEEKGLAARPKRTRRSKSEVLQGNPSAVAWQSLHTTYQKLGDASEDETEAIFGYLLFPPGSATASMELSALLGKAGQQRPSLEEEGRAAARKLLKRNPKLKLRSPEVLASNLDSLVEILGIPRRKVVQVLLGQPHLLEMAPQTVAHNFACLHQTAAKVAPGIGHAQITEAVCLFPPILAMSPDTWKGKVAALQEAMCASHLHDIFGHGLQPHSNAAAMHAPCSSEGLQPHSNAAAMHDPCSGSHKGIGPSLSPIDVDSGREMHVTIGRSSRSTNSGSSNNGGRIMHATIGSSSSSSGGRNARDGLVHVFGAGELTRNGSYDGSVNRGSKEKAMLTFVSVPTLCRHASDKLVAKWRRLEAAALEQHKQALAAGKASHGRQGRDHVEDRGSGHTLACGDGGYVPSWPYQLQHATPKTLGRMLSASHLVLDRLDYVATTIIPLMAHLSRTPPPNSCPMSGPNLGRNMKVGRPRRVPGRVEEVQQRLQEGHACLPQQQQQLLHASKSQQQPSPDHLAADALQQQQQQQQQQQNLQAPLCPTLQQQQQLHGLQAPVYPTFFELRNGPDFWLPPSPLLPHNLPYEGVSFPIILTMTPERFDSLYPGYRTWHQQRLGPHQTKQDRPVSLSI